MGRRAITTSGGGGEGAERLGGVSLAARVATGVPVEEQAVDGDDFRLERSDEDRGEGAVFVGGFGIDPEAGDEGGSEGRLEAIGPAKERRPDTVRIAN